jgi:hypothetical protein
MEMARLHRLAATVLLLCFPLVLDAQYQIVELAGVQLAKSLSATIQDPTGSPMPKALVQEFSPDWKTVLRTSATGTDGKFSLPTVKGQKIYCLQISAPGFDPLRVRVQVDPKHGTRLKLKLEIAT